MCNNFLHSETIVQNTVVGFRTFDVLNLVFYFFERLYVMSYIVEINCDGFGIYKFDRLDTNLHKFLRRHVFVVNLMLLVLYLVDATFLIGLIKLRRLDLIEA